MEPEVDVELEEELGIEIESTESISVFRTTIRLTKKDKIAEAVEYLRKRLFAGKATGKMYLNLSLGGTQSVVTEEIDQMEVTE